MGRINIPENWGKPVLFLYLVEQANYLERLRAQLEDESSFELYLCVLPTVRALRQRLEQIGGVLAEEWPVPAAINDDCRRLTERLSILLKSLVHIPDARPETIRRLRDEHLAGCCYRIEYFEHRLRTLAEACLRTQGN